MSCQMNSFYSFNFCSIFSFILIQAMTEEAQETNMVYFRRDESMDKTKTTKKISTGPSSAAAVGRYGSLLPGKTLSVVVEDDRSIRPL